jgi:hypothetical protein
MSLFDSVVVNKYPTGVFSAFRKSGAEVSFVDFGRRLNVGVAATFLRDDRHLNFPQNGAQVASCAVRCEQNSLIGSLISFIQMRY